MSFHISSWYLARIAADNSLRMQEIVSCGTQKVKQRLQQLSLVEQQQIATASFTLGVKGCQIFIIFFCRGSISWTKTSWNKSSSSGRRLQSLPWPLSLELHHELIVCTKRHRVDDPRLHPESSPSPLLLIASSECTACRYRIPHTKVVIWYWSSSIAWI